MIQNKKDLLQKKEIELQDKLKQITELTLLNVSLQKDVINILYIKVNCYFAL